LKREDPMPFPRPIREFRTIRRLLGGAERLAGEMGDALPGAEHLLLAALDLPDGSARRSFERLAVDPAGLAAAIAAQHDDALRAVGVDVDGAAHLDGPAPPRRGVFRATPAGQAVFQRAVEVSGTPKPRRLLGAHVVLAVTEMERGSTARALRLMGVDRQQLAAAARAELAISAG
jgi:ATP-dependent Clp protease ATP-binding subunit ClpA